MSCLLTSVFTTYRELHSTHHAHLRIRTDPHQLDGTEVTASHHYPHLVQQLVCLTSLGNVGQPNLQEVLQGSKWMCGIKAMPRSRLGKCAGKSKEAGTHKWNKYFYPQDDNV